MSTSITTTEYLHFERASSPTGKTMITLVRSRRTMTLLGRIRWYGPWRQYCFEPEGATVWNKGCLDDIQAEIARLMDERRSR